MNKTVFSNYIISISCTERVQRDDAAFVELSVTVTKAWSNGEWQPAQISPFFAFSNPMTARETRKFKLLLNEAYLIAEELDKYPPAAPPPFELPKAYTDVEGV